MIKPHPVGLKEGAPFTVADDEDWNRSEVEAPDLHDDAGQSRKPRAFRKVDMRPAFRQTQRMNRKYHMSGHFGTFACLLIAIVMIAVPPSVSHAASETHGDRQGTAVSASYDCPHHRDEMARTDRKDDAHGQRVGTSDTPASDDCCDGICQSAVIDVPSANDVTDVQKSAFRLWNDQSASIRMVVLIRPPRT